MRISTNLITPQSLTNPSRPSIQIRTGLASIVSRGRAAVASPAAAAHQPSAAVRQSAPDLVEPAAAPRTSDPSRSDAAPSRASRDTGGGRGSRRTVLQGETQAQNSPLQSDYREAGAAAARGSLEAETQELLRGAHGCERAQRSEESG